MAATITADQWGAYWAQELEWANTNPREYVKSACRTMPTWHSRQLISILNLALENIVARGKTTAPAAAAKKPGQWTDFVDIPVGDLAMGAVHQKYGAFDASSEALVGLLEHGYRMSFSYNQGNDAFICSVTCKAEGDVNNGCTFNAFAGTWYEAMLLALYKHYDISGGVWKKASGGSTRPMFG